MKKIIVVFIILLVMPILYFSLILTLISQSKIAFAKSDYSDLKVKLEFLSATIYPLEIIALPVKDWHQQIHAAIELLDFTAENIDTYNYFQGFYKGILHKNKLQVASNWNKLFPKLNKFLDLAPKIQKDLIFLQNKHPKLTAINFEQPIDWDLVKDLLLQVPNLVGLDGSKKTYLIFLQNQKELRPTGGFMGSYVQVSFQDGILLDIKGQDIYVPDGALAGHVNPPEPIQAAFKTGFWKLRDANWDPDFRVSADNIRWFLDKANFSSGDAIIAVNFSAVEDLLDLFNEIYLPDNNQTISKENLYLSAQNAAENDFFPGSTQKKDFLQNLLNQIFIKFQDLNHKQIRDLFKLVLNNLQHKNIILNFSDKKLQDLAQKENWAGQISIPKKYKDQDYLYLVESNLGANKANCCVQRSVNLNVNIANNLQNNLLQIDYRNLSQKATEQPPKFWGGDYRNYLRLYLPKDIVLDQATIDGKSVSVDKSLRKDPQLRVVGFFVNVPHLKTKRVIVKYHRKLVSRQTLYRIFLQKQSGLWPFEFDLNVNYAKQTYNRKLQIDKDQQIVINY